ncbi:FAD/NAD(P)-binding protein [Gaiella sp.]|uniref:FAD/NAD(P)-binding protein n=1 Tax=Gaiella sp. TaxID=2663207 RepID=UPI002E375D55|nr:FAD/NAD(P)-binding protein [Gaiella sp.]HEX5585654.1 FAD/NAD(P)-binding protein [Gaiella sp.]
MSGRTIAIVGAGFSGITVAVHLLRAAPPGLDRLYLVERAEGRVGGVAYRTPSASHTLNVPAGRMSAFEDDPEDFLRFVRRREPALTGGSFVPRKLYGEYLADALEEARRTSSLPLVRVAGEVVSVAESGDGLVLALADGRRLEVGRAVLAIGNYPPSDPSVGDGAVFSSIRYARDPWAGDALELDRREDVLLVGTGLTMCDVALALRDADQQGRIFAVSRRGLLPQPHRLSAKPPPHLDPPATLDVWPSSAVGLLRGLRREVKKRAGEGVDWREVVTSIRADTPALWQRLDEEERRRFLRHARPYWETHRHRSSPEAAHAIEELVETRRLELVAGSLEALAEEDGGVVATLRRRGSSASETLRVGKVINCTGPDTDLTRVRDPLVASLRRDGLIRPDPLGLGLDTDDDGRLVAADGTASGCLTLLGPLRKGRLWEHTAVPELRVAAQRVADRLVREATLGV